MLVYLLPGSTFALARFHKSARMLVTRDNTVDFFCSPLSIARRTALNLVAKTAILRGQSLLLCQLIESLAGPVEFCSRI